MTDNTNDRLHDVFFYGLYMDPAILEGKGVNPRNPRKASVQDYQLSIGNKATLLRAKGMVAHGMVYSLTHSEIDSLYWGAGLHEYRAEALHATTHELNQKETTLPVLCCNLLDPPEPNESNLEYETRLRETMINMGLPILY